MEQFIATTLRATAPIAIVALAGVFSWRAGIFHLGLEGLMLIGAFCAVAGTVATGQPVVGILLAIVVCMLVSVVLWVVIVPLRANAVIAGLGLTTLGLGATSYALDLLFATRGAIYTETPLWRPITGVERGPMAALSELSILVWLVPPIAVACWVVLRRTHFGLRLAAVGEFPFAARSAGTSPARMRLVALVITGALCAIGGAELSLGSLGAFTENMTQGRGFIGFTAVIFGAGDPLGAVLASLFFGTADAVGIQTQLVTQGLPIPRPFILMLPYLLTIAAVWASSVARRDRGQVPGAFGELREG